MAQTTIKKNAKGYGYTYTDMAQIHEQLEALGWSYYQYIEREDGEDYIYTVPIIDGTERPARRGCKVIETSPSGKTNPAQAYGSGLTYARRYSLLMAFGFATSDDDAQTLNNTVKKREAEEQAKAKPTPKPTPKKKEEPKHESRVKHEAIVTDLATELGYNIDTLLASWKKPPLSDLSDADLLKTLDWLESKRGEK